MTASGEGPDPVDVHVGRRVRLRRKELGASQQWLAEKLDLTFQQIQKYERGANRISASKLHKVASALKTPVAYFFEGLSDAATAADEHYGRAYSEVIEDLLADPNGPQLAEAFLKIQRRSIKKQVVGLVEAIAENQADAHEPLERRAAE